VEHSRADHVRNVGTTGPTNEMNTINMKLSQPAEIRDYVLH